ncbi:ABC transporter substrate-binding protein [Rhodovulum sulfidophilum]|uniref:ABC transporter substrate-binding protein n=1 Tax=Rhodovulum sulfidophilum TaxID=35806 RepID=UPI001F2C6CC2|nr:ABC transporter substrate-binding protein [Rhodovulum sulfidophilum]MCE8431875.1 ABC transporter substrate-binding protein [Rhodovulum sulfidophilum]MCF4115812.1 ABC transporter substrate-binding protein [Rhodovulum sulfidophilum]
MTAGRPLSRRQLVAGASALAMMTGRGAHAEVPGPPERIVALDWALAETLVALGVAPLAVAEAPLYAKRVVVPALPPGTADAGLRSWPNLEALRALRPDLVVALEGYGIAPARLEAIAPVRALPIYTAARRPLALAREAVTALAGLCGREAAGRRLLAGLDAALAPPVPGQRPVLIVKFADERVVDIYGRGSLFDDVARARGLENAWRGPTNIWGFASAGLEELARHPETRLLVIEPAPARLLHQSAIWQALPQQRAGRVGLLPPAWVFGGVPSAIRFARLLEAA